jgi:hypothetical protein
MDFDFYLDSFNKSASRLNQKRLHERQLEWRVGIKLNSVYLKLFKKSWTGDTNEPLTAESRIFFSIWVNGQTIQQQKLFYNIHAFKLRKLKGYSIASRSFAKRFRDEFKEFQPGWQNVSVNFGPLTLMEGWEFYEPGNLEIVVEKLANNFLTIEHLVDDTLKVFKTKAVIHP